MFMGGVKYHGDAKDVWHCHCFAGKCRLIDQKHVCQEHDISVEAHVLAKNVLPLS